MIRGSVERLGAASAALRHDGLLSAVCVVAALATLGVGKVDPGQSGSFRTSPSRQRQSWGHLLPPLKPLVVVNNYGAERAETPFTNDHLGRASRNSRSHRSGRHSPSSVTQPPSGAQSQQFQVHHGLHQVRIHSCLTHPKPSIVHLPSTELFFTNSLRLTAPRPQHPLQNGQNMLTERTTDKD